MQLKTFYSNFIELNAYIRKQEMKPIIFYFKKLEN